ncbi:SGNH/GDSL hydrolase family protein [Coleofasciculus sp. LEGE 07081]|uniref:SGNH/GDSL hydrolase family protein n=1 Tax=unclassified Coleofasciculus TaxID=2692782 RepID=UPI001880B156|nr:SGNH/GDSL hydrolase family protein [Coleofasciculus sp. LEGE 07081]MBE9147876.1 SGNH/GDSL hydrolase family protein [Coleofasciculus sp. LEGE 07092]
MILAVLVGLLAIVEVSLRLVFGFGNPPIYIADEKIGYLLAPNQRTKRMGNRIAINEYSMRSDAISPERTPSTLRVLLLGDSIINGGWWTDQDQTISALIATQLKTVVAEASRSVVPQIPFEDIEVLNASANSWGPRNELAYLERFGSFDAQVVVLVINTDDLFATAPTPIPVGRDRFYPSHKPPLAIIEAISRFLPYQSPPEMAAVRAEKGDRVGFNLEAIQQMQALSQDAGAEFLLLMTPLLREIGEPGPRDYEIKARNRLSELAKDQQIPYVDLLSLFNSAPEPETLYRDHIHLSPQGNQTVSEVMGRSLQPLFVGD